MAKILISGVANTGKTTLLQSLTDVLVFANDGKKYPFKQPHVNIEVINTADEFITTVTEAMERYNEKMGDYPKTIAFDSISKTLLDIEAHYLATVNSFPYGPIGKDISYLMNWIENELVKQGFNVIFVSHAVKDGDGVMSLVTAGGSSGKRGGVIADVDNAIYVDVNGKRRMVYHKDPKRLSRSLQEDTPVSESVEDFNLQVYLDKLLESENEVDEFSI